MGTVIALYLVLVNLVTFALYGVDKRRAEQGAWRISEKVLLLLAFLGGAVGALAGMLVFRHKTRKWKFRIAVPLALVLTLAVGGGALYVSDYYHADDVALRAAASNMVEEGAEVGSAADGIAGEASAHPGERIPADDVSVRVLSGGALAFMPREPRAGLVFYPGAKVQPESYAPLMRRCAEEGFLCVLLKPPFNLAILGVDAPRGIMEQFPDVDRWIIAGHSMGGVAAAQYLADHSDEFAGIVFLASYPAADLSAYPGAVLSIVGSEDSVLNRENYESARSKLPAGAREVVIEGGNHAGFGNYGEQAGDGQAAIACSDQQAQTAQAIAALL